MEFRCGRQREAGPTASESSWCLLRPSDPTIGAIVYFEAAAIFRQEPGHQVELGHLGRQLGQLCLPIRRVQRPPEVRISTISFYGLRGLHRRRNGARDGAPHSGTWIIIPSSDISSGYGYKSTGKHRDLCRTVTCTTGSSCEEEAGVVAAGKSRLQGEIRQSGGGSRPTASLVVVPPGTVAVRRDSGFHRFRQAEGQRLRAASRFPTVRVIVAYQYRSDGR